MFLKILALITKLQKVLGEDVTISLSADDIFTMRIKIRWYNETGDLKFGYERGLRDYELELQDDVICYSIEADVTHRYEQMKIKEENDRNVDNESNSPSDS